MAKAKILLVESERASAPSFASALEKKGYAVLRVHRVRDALRAAERERPDVVVLDAASMMTSGARMYHTLRSRLNGAPVILVSPEGSRPAVNGTVLVHPLTHRKLTNRIARVLPGDERDEIRAGPIRLNLAQRKVRCVGREARLTPRAAALLQVLMESPSRLLTREELMKRVWSTDYMGDTRTLDVHMSWLRRALEPNPVVPKYLKTIRGLGYRLDLPDGAY